jgi:hypothetical protein
VPRSCAAAVLFASLVLCACAHVRAADRYRADAIAQSPGLPIVDDVEAQHRVAYIQRVLDAQRRPIQIWRYGWIAAYSVLALGSLARPVLVGSDELAAAFVGLGGTSIGLASVLLNDENAGHAGNDLRGYLARTRDPWPLRLRVAEQAFRACARDEAFVHSWPAQFARVLVSVSSWAVVTFAARQERSGAVNLGVGLTVGQLSAHTHPTGMLDAWNRYVARHPDVEGRSIPFVDASAPRWAVVPAPSGPEFVVTF